MAMAALFLTSAILLARRFAGDFRQQMVQLAVVITAGLPFGYFQRQRSAFEDFGEGRAVAWYRSALRLMIRYRYAFTGGRSCRRPCRGGFADRNRKSFASQINDRQSCFLYRCFR